MDLMVTGMILSCTLCRLTYLQHYHPIEIWASESLCPSQLEHVHAKNENKSNIVTKLEGYYTHVFHNTSVGLLLIWLWSLTRLWGQSGTQLEEAIEIEYCTSENPRDIQCCLFPSCACDFTGVFGSIVEMTEKVCWSSEPQMLSILYEQDYFHMVIIY